MASLPAAALRDGDVLERSVRAEQHDAQAGALRFEREQQQPDLVVLARARRPRSRRGPVA